VAPAQQMEVKMRDRLPTVQAHVVHDAPALGQAVLLGDLARRQQDRRQDLGVLRGHRRKRRDRLDGDDQAVERRLGVDIVDREHEIVLVHEACGDLPGVDLLKQGPIGHAHKIDFTISFCGFRAVAGAPFPALFAHAAF